MHLTTFVITLICGVLLLIGTWRIVRIPAGAGIAWWSYTEVLFLVGLAKLARTPDIADRFMNPRIAAAIGVNNGMTLVGMTLGALVAVPAVLLMCDMVGYRPSLVVAAIVQIAIAVGMVITFSLSQIPSSAPSSYITQSVPMPWTVQTWLYWVIFLGSIGTAALINLFLALHALRVVRRGTFALALFGWVVTSGAACLYIMNKLANLALESWQPTGGVAAVYLKHVSTISLVLILVVAGSFITTLAIYPLHRLPRRIRRYRMLRRGVETWRTVRLEQPESVLPDIAVPQPGRVTLWRAASTPLSAYNLQIELADTSDG